MKKTFFAAALLLSFALVACNQKPQEPADEAEAQAAEAVDASKPVPADQLDHTITTKEINDVSYLLGINLGSFIKGYNFGDKFNYKQMMQGVKDFVNSKGSRMDPDFDAQFKVSPGEMDQLFNKFLEKMHYAAAEANTKAGEKYLEANRKKAGVVVAESGLQYKIIEAGNDVKPAAEDTVFVHYCGKHLDGSIFDEVPADAEPTSFPLNHVIPGWTEGMTYIGEGGKIQLTVPSELAYGEMGAQGAIEPNETLIFDITLDKVSKAQKTAE